MRKLAILSLLFASTALLGQEYNYEPTKKHPYGRPHPEAPQELLDFDPLIGLCDCKSVARIGPNEWADTLNMKWTFKYIMNGKAVQDETLKEDGSHSGSIRQFNSDSSRWYVHYYSSATPVPSLPAWEGNKNEEGKIILYRPQTAPNGMEGFFRLTFSNISAVGYDWVGEWVDPGETIIYPTWKIYCKKVK